MRAEAFDALASLLTYPRAGYRDRVAAALIAVEPRSGSQQAPLPARVGVNLRVFFTSIETLALDELEEAFTTTFDLDPVAALEVGWHLHGDTYERGRFMVEMRQRLHRLALSESGELPDHLATTLRVLPRLESGEATYLARHAVIPALEKILEPLRARSSMFTPLVEAVAESVAESFAPGTFPSPQPIPEEATP